MSPWQGVCVREERAATQNPLQSHEPDVLFQGIQCSREPTQVSSAEGFCMRWSLPLEKRFWCPESTKGSSLSGYTNFPLANLSNPSFRPSQHPGIPSFHHHHVNQTLNTSHRYPLFLRAGTQATDNGKRHAVACLLFSRIAIKIWSSPKSQGCIHGVGTSVQCVYCVCIHCARRWFQRKTTLKLVRLFHVGHTSIQHRLLHPRSLFYKNRMSQMNVSIQNVFLWPEK